MAADVRQVAAVWRRALAATGQRHGRDDDERDETRSVSHRPLLQLLTTEPPEAARSWRPVAVEWRESDSGAAERSNDASAIARCDFPELRHAWLAYHRESGWALERYDYWFRSTDWLKLL